MLKPTKTTSVLFSNSIYHFAINHTIAFFVPKETQPILSQNPARCRHTVAINHRSRRRHHTVAINRDASPQTPATLHLRRRQRFTSDAGDASARDRDASDTSDASARFQSRRSRRRRPFCSDRQRFSSIRDASVPIATLQISIAGDASSFAIGTLHPSQRRRFTPIVTLQLSIADDASRFFFIYFIYLFFLNA